MASLSEQRSFIAQYGSAAQSASTRLGIPQQYVLGQWALETGWGTKFAGSYNVGNVQGNDPVPRSYKSLDEGVNAYVKVMQLDRYSSALKSTSPGEFGMNLKAGGYAADPDYAFKIGNVINSVSTLQPMVGDDWQGIFGYETYDTGPTGGDGISMDDITSFADAPLNWVKAQGLNIVFVGLGIIGILLVAYKNSDVVTESVKQVGKV